MINRKLDELNRITIPKEMVKTLNWKERQEVGIDLRGNKIILTTIGEFDWEEEFKKVEECNSLDELTYYKVMYKDLTDFGAMFLKKFIEYRIKELNE